jgi:hypothetical protein
MNDLFLNDRSVRERLWTAAGAGENFEGEIQLVVNNVVED